MRDSKTVRIEMSFDDFRQIASFAADHTDDPAGRLLYNITMAKLAAMQRREEYRKRP